MNDGSERYTDDDDDLIHIIPVSREVGLRRHKLHRMTIATGVVIGALLLGFGLVNDSAVVFWWGAIILIATVFGGQRFCYRRSCRVFIQSR